MPIYAYKCGSCGHAKDVLQKMSDALLTVCPACGAEAFTKQVTAAGFQLKGSGWYVTDFRGGNSASAPASDAAAEDKSDTKAESKPDSAASAPAAPSESSAAAPKKEAANANVVSTPAASSSNTSSS
ncbi:MAG: zinc ribbon domain-containing protein [Burkholderiaceae bacterium]|nr:zinc ribbon domain-containing protein [Burkholderiaceae bacterium]